jgi:hypothetical protein
MHAAIPLTNDTEVFEEVVVEVARLPRESKYLHDFSKNK